MSVSMRRLRQAANQAGGVLIGVSLPSRSRFNAIMARYAPGCGAPTNVVGTNAGKMPCGGTLRALDGETRRYFCASCEDRVSRGTMPRVVQVSGRDGNVSLRRALGEEARVAIHPVTQRIIAAVGANADIRVDAASGAVVITIPIEQASAGSCSVAEPGVART